MTTNFLQQCLEKRKKSGLYRTLKTSEGLVDLTSNDYFGFARSECAVKHFTVQAGSTGSRLLTGNHSIFEEVEAQIASFLKAESCLIFNSGYVANLGLISALGAPNTIFIYDLHVHASIIDGMKLSKSKCIPFRHNDMHSLEIALIKACKTRTQSVKPKNPSAVVETKVEDMHQLAVKPEFKEIKPEVFVLVESVYSIEGDRAPLFEIVKLCEKYGARLIVDEAHALGIYGEIGEGLVCALGLQSRVFARVYTFSKTLGLHGACVVGSEILIDYLVQFSRPFIYTTAMALPFVKQIGLGYQRLQNESRMHQKRLQQLISYFHMKLEPLYNCKSKNFEHEDDFECKTVLQLSDGPIQSIVFGDIQRVKLASEKLREANLDVRPIVFPTVKRGNECLRVVLHSFNQEDEIDRLCDVLMKNQKVEIAALNPQQNIPELDLQVVNPVKCGFGVRVG